MVECKVNGIRFLTANEILSVKPRGCSHSEIPAVYAKVPGDGQGVLREEFHDGHVFSAGKFSVDIRLLL
jgi:hypothetical protein